MTIKKTLIILVIAVLASTAAQAQWSGSGPRWRYNGQETMYVGSLQSGGQGFSFGYAWGRQRNLGAIEFWPIAVFKDFARFESEVFFEEGFGHINDNGTVVTVMGHSNSEQYGLMGLSDRFGNVNVGMSGNGVIYGITKSFVVDHPSETNLLIRYTALEGSSPDIYFSGTSTVTDGVAVVEYPEHFSALAKSGTHTITVTPRSPQSKGLCVADRSDGGFVVAELFSGTGNYEFDFYVVAKRSGFDDYEVYLTKGDDAAKAGKRSKNTSSGPSFETKQSFKDVTGVSRKTR